MKLPGHPPSGPAKHEQKKRLLIQVPMWYSEEFEKSTLESKKLDVTALYVKIILNVLKVLKIEIS